MNFLDVSGKTFLRGSLSGCRDNYRPQTKLQKGNVFTPVCDSVHRRGRCTPPGQTPPLGRHTPRQTPPPLRQTPRADTPLGKTPPWADTPLRDGHCSGRYAFYWNAFLFYNCIYYLLIDPCLLIIKIVCMRKLGIKTERLND